MALKRAKTILGLAFAAMAGYSLLVGYAAQKKTANPPCQTAYHHTKSRPAEGRTKTKPESVEGKIGTSADGIEYVVTDFNNPKVEVTAKVANEHSFGFRAEPKTGSSGFYAKATLGDFSKLHGSAEFDRNCASVTASSSSYFDTWVEKAAFQYLGNYGKKPEHKLNIGLGVNLWGKRMNWTPSYDIGKRQFDFGSIRKA